MPGRRHNVLSTVAMLGLILLLASGNKLNICLGPDYLNMDYLFHALRNLTWMILFLLFSYVIVDENVGSVK